MAWPNFWFIFQHPARHTLCFFYPQLNEIVLKFSKTLLVNAHTRAQAYWEKTNTKTHRNPNQNCYYPEKKNSVP